MKIAIVTGASSGMGREFAKQLPYFYKNLDEIWIIARRKERLVSLAVSKVIPYRVFEGDLLEDDVYECLEDALAKKTPEVRMLVNAAGYGKIGSFSSLSRNKAQEQLGMIDLNCRALTRMISLCLPYMESGSRIINIASAAAFCPQPGLAAYAASKSYVLSLSRALSFELKRREIYVTAVCPGPVDTEFFEVAGSIDNWLKKLVLADPVQVVRTALIDSRNKKDVSVYGTVMKAASIVTKILPHHLVMKFF